MQYERIDVGGLQFGFNRFTGEIIKFDSEEEALSVYNKNLCTKIQDVYPIESIRQEHQHPTCLAITVELNYICNLNCIYCYQTRKGIRPEISIDCIDKIAEYITNVYAASPFRILILRFIGGEPLLSIPKLDYCYTKVTQFCEMNKILMITHIDSNGTIPFANLIKKISNLDMVICLSNQADHNQKRSNSYGRILNNLAELSYTEAANISICYNVDHTNIDQFESFLQLLHSSCPQVKKVLTARIDDSWCAPEYTNKMTENEFARWNSTVAIDLLIKYGYPIVHSISTTLNICQGHSRYSCKVHSDGSITACDAMFIEESRLTIDELLQNVDLLKERYEDIKGVSPIDDPECSVCPSLIQCGGKVFCRDEHNRCNYQADFNERAFIKTYIKHTLEGNSKYFINM